jgi:hypothetical protein
MSTRFNTLKTIERFVLTSDRGAATFPDQGGIPRAEKESGQETTRVLKTRNESTALLNLLVRK